MEPAVNSLLSWEDSTSSPVNNTNQSDQGIVISGISGLYPESNSVKDLSEILYNKINPINKDNSRWKYDHPEVVQYTGKVPGLKRFDAQFFKVHFRLGANMDAMGRKILEQSYQAIYDAGISPEELSGKKVGVYVGTCFSESEKVSFYVAGSRTGFGIAGCSKSMFANRISYWLNVKGPSIAIDEACCSSTRALQQAYLAISRGECEAAIVGGTNLCLHPQSSIHCGRTMKLSVDGKTKSFDTEAAGCAKSEAINVLFLQHAKDALRIYAEVIHVSCQFTSHLRDESGNPKYGFYRDPEIMANFISNFYKDAKIPPQEVEYVEAFGSAVPEADKAELEAIEKVFCHSRNYPLLVGSVMSNIGYGEAASAISAITKIILGYHTGQLAGNLNCDAPRRDVAALRDGRMRILTDHETFGRSYTAVNGLSLTGVNAHILLDGRYKHKNLLRYKTSIPHLVLLSGRQENSVYKTIKDLKSRCVDPEEIALLHNIHKCKISGHLGRGFIVLDTNEKKETVSLCEKADYFDEAKRPLWFVYSGMGSQWAGMGAQLMRIPIFAAAIEKCRLVLEPKGVDIVHIITSPDKTIFDNILNSFVGIAAIQIGLTDVLRALEIVPDKIIGHSVGELGCAYADGCFTAEEMILSAYSRGLVSVQTPFIRGTMAAVGLGYLQISKLCPPEIEVACHNGPDSSTISGPAEVMAEFVAQLTAREIFAKEVPCSNIAYHSRYIAEAGPGLLKYLSEVITSPKVRSERWVSTSVPQEKWNEPIAQYSSAEYHTNNLLNSVLFEETSRLIPANAVVVEIAPHGLLQAILKRSLPESCTHVPLTRRRHIDNVQFLLEAIGKLYMKGCNPQIQALYPKIEFPVSTGTPMLSHLVEWSHNDVWNVPLYTSANRKTAAACTHVISIHDDVHQYLKGHVISEKNVYPFAASLVAVWDTLAMFLEVPKKQLSVQFRDVYLRSQPVLHDQRQLRLCVTVHKGNGYFEVLDDSIEVVSGFIVGNIDRGTSWNKKWNSDNVLELKSDDIYQIFSAKDYNYSDEFRSIYNANLSLSKAHILWQNNWVTLIDGMIQLNALRRTHETISQPNYIRRIVIDVETHLQNQTLIDNANVVPAEMCEVLENTRCGGVIIETIKFHDLSTTDKKEFTLKAQKNVSGNSFEDIWSGQIYLPTKEFITTGKDMSLEMTRLGDIESMRWIEGTESSLPGISVKVKYAGLNAAYIKKILRVNAREHKSYNKFIEYDFSGLTDRKERVMGIMQEESINSHVKAKPELLWPVPEHWTLEDAATVPLAYCLAFYCLCFKGRIFRNNSILVHGGAGALGQAVISIALAHNCDVYTTVSNIKKKEFLLKLFPELKENHIGYSRDYNNFVDMTLRGTNGKGCDIVITSVKEDLRNASINCCAPFGYIVDASLVLDNEDYKFGLFHLATCKAYCTQQLSLLFESKNVAELKKLQLMVSEGIARGYVRPLSRVVYAAGDAPRALRLQAGNRHLGRVLLQLEGNITCIQYKINCSSDRWQLLFTEHDVLGMQLAERLISRGATKLLLHFSVRSNFLLFKLRSWEKQGIQCAVSYGNMWDENIFKLFNNETPENVEGIFCIFNSTEQHENNPKYLEHLTSIIRRSNWSLKHFAVINTGEKVNEVIKRTNHDSKFTIIKLPCLTISKNLKHKENFSISRAINAIEKSLCYKERFIIAHATSTPSVNILQDVAAIADISISSATSQEATLQDLGMDISKSSMVRTYLRDNHYILLNESTIPLLTVKKIRQLDDNASQKKYTEAKDLNSFFSHVDQDELLATTEIVFLPTLTTSDALRDDEFDVNRTFLCIVPGVEGLHTRFRELCERLKLPALVLQPGVDRPHETVEEMAQRYATNLLKKARLRKHFYLLGYESGVLVALEMAAIFEDHGLTGTIFCIGGAPEGILANFEENLSDFKTEESLQVAIARHLFRLMINNYNVEDLEIELKNNSTWEEKLSSCVQKLLGRIDHSIQYAQELIEASYARIVHVRQYRCSAQPRALRSLLISIRPRSTVANGAPSFSMQRYSQQKEVEYELEAPLAYAAQDLRCAAIINRHLDEDILEEFDKRNLCQTYITNVDSFMTTAENVIDE